jgi:hypothetical protein
MAYATTETRLDELLGCFLIPENGNRFEYIANNDGIYPEFPHKVFVGPLGQTLYANVKKTVVEVLVNEDEVEKWDISHRHSLTWRKG